MHIRQPGCCCHREQAAGGSEDIDFNLPGLLAIQWARRYDSRDMRSDGLLGMGWSVPYEVELARVPHPQGGTLWIYIDNDGNRLELGRLSAGDAFISAVDGLAFFQLEDGQTVVEDINEGLYRVFDTDPLNPKRSRLIRLGDRNLNCLDLLYDEQGRLKALYDKYGQTVVQLHYAARHPQRVSEVSRVFLKNGGTPTVERSELLVSYRYTDNGQLHEVLDATDQRVRRFTYTPRAISIAINWLAVLSANTNGRASPFLKRALLPSAWTARPTACLHCWSPNPITNGE